MSDTLAGAGRKADLSELNLFHKGCSVCGGKLKARGLCINHYAKFRRGTLDIEAPTSRAFSDDEREAKYVEVLPNGCWHWTGGLDGRGYGKVLQAQAHRWMYERKVGPIPEGKDLDHVCHNEDPECAGGIECLHRRCVNPEHLRPVTRKENLNSGNGLGGAKYSAKTECPQGHDISSNDAVYTEDRGDGRVGRRCIKCAKESSKRSYQRRMGNE